MSVVLISGCSTGIGLVTAVRLAGKGHRVYASMRDTGRSMELQRRAEAAGLKIEVCEMDVNDLTSVKNCVDDIHRREGRLEVLVNNAGIGPMGPIEEMDDTAVRSIFETNVFGALRTIRAVLPSMRQHRSGTIINVSSVAGRVAAGCMGIYSASKFALEAISEALAQELVPYGIRVAVVEPSFTRTPILDKVLKSLNAHEETAYPQVVARNQALFTQAHEIGDPSEAVAEVIETAIHDPAPKLRYTVGLGAKAFIDGRGRMSDEDWIAMGRHETLTDYFQEFGERFPMPA